MTSWAAPHGGRPACARRVELPGSKSLTNRVLVLAALADGPSRIVAPLRARDTLLMADALRALGVEIVDDGADWIVTPAPLHGADDRHRAGRHGHAVPAAGRRARRRRRRASTATPTRANGRWRPCSTGCGRPASTIDDGGRGRMPFTVRGTRRGRRRRRPHRRVGVVAVRVRAAAVRRALRQGHRGRAHRRIGRPVATAPRHDGRRAAQRGRRGRDAVVRRVARRARPDQRARLDRRTRPVQRRAVPGRSARHRRLGDGAALARVRRPRPATSCATLLAAMGAQRAATATVS